MITETGFRLEDRAAVFHADDLGMCHGANVAFSELSRRGSITCGAVMVPCPWFLEVVEMAGHNPELDIGVHLTLTSEWKTYRWGPVSTARKSSGLIDEQGCFYHRVPMLAAHVVAEAAEAEMRAQIDRALELGLDITHLDTHMGAAFLPQLFDIYLKLGMEYRLPVLLPRAISDYTSVLDVGVLPAGKYQDKIRQLKDAGWPLVDHFRMTPGVPSDKARTVYYQLIKSLPRGVTFVALHPTCSGEIEAIVPLKAHFRTDEYQIFRDKGWPSFVRKQHVVPLGFRRIRDLLREKVFAAESRPE